MATDQLSLFQTQEQNITHLGSNPSKLETTTVTNTSQKGRMPNSGGNNQAKKKKNKIPRRGMGVAQLELLRLQELSKSQQVENSLTINPKPTQQATPFQYYCNMGYNNGGIGSGRVASNPFNVGGNVVPRHVFETSTELTSMPKMMVMMCPTNRQHFEACDLLSCDFCFKKKWIDEEKQEYFGRRYNLGHTFPYHGHDFLKSNHENNVYFNAHEMGGFSAIAARNAFYANHNFNEGLEGVPINCWKGSSVGEGVVVMEHEFFPVENVGSTNPKEMEFGSEALGPIGSEAKFCLTASDYSGCSASNVSNYVDLSLKL